MAELSTSDPAQLSTPELAELLVRLEEGVDRTVAGFKSGAVLVGLLFAVMGLPLAAKGLWPVSLIMLAFGGGIVWLGFVAARKTGPARAAPVLLALRTQPTKVDTIAHKITSDSRGIFTSHWIEVRTGDGRLFVKANDDWQLLLALLERRCPGASIRS